MLTTFAGKFRAMRCIVSTEMFDELVFCHADCAAVFDERRGLHASSRRADSRYSTSTPFVCEGNRLMPWPYIAPIALLFCSNVFMTFAWVSGRRAQRASMSGGHARGRERPELERGAGGLIQDIARQHRSFAKEIA